jgi:biopolymer transport protein ExbD
MKLFAISTRTIGTRTINTRTISGAALVLALALFAPAAGRTQQLQRGVSVKMAFTTSGPEVPDADNQDAWIVTVTSDNHMYFGVDPVTPEGLFDAMKDRPRNREQELYIKADGQASFATVKQILQVAHADLFEKAVLLTAQSSGVPHGLTVWMSSSARPEGIVVQIDPGQASPVLKIDNDNEEAPLSALEQKLKQLLQGRREAVVLKAGQVQFADFAHVVDVCNKAGAKPVLGTPEL